MSPPLFVLIKGANTFVGMSWLATCWHIITDRDQCLNVVINRSWTISNDTRSRTNPALATCFSLCGIIWNNLSRRWGEEQDTLRLRLLSCVWNGCSVGSGEQGRFRDSRLLRVSVSEEELELIKYNDIWVWPLIPTSQNILTSLSEELNIWQRNVSPSGKSSPYAWPIRSQKSMRWLISLIKITFLGEGELICNHFQKLSGENPAQSGNRCLYWIYDLTKRSAWGRIPIMLFNSNKVKERKSYSW